MLLLFSSLFFKPPSCLRLSLLCLFTVLPDALLRISPALGLPHRFSENPLHFFSCLLVILVPHFFVLLLSVEVIHKLLSVAFVAPAFLPLITPILRVRIIVLFLSSGTIVLAWAIILLVSRGTVLATAGCSYFIVLSFDSFIWEDLVCFVDFFELFLFSFVGVGMILFGEAPECLFDFILRGLFRNIQHFVVIFAFIELLDWKAKPEKSIRSHCFLAWYNL